MVPLKPKGYFYERPTPTGNHYRISGRAHNAKSAYARGYRYAIISPKGHPISFHMTDRKEGTGFYSLSKSGCKIVPLVELLNDV